MSMREFPVVSVSGPRSCPDVLLRVMSDLEIEGNVVLGPHIWADCKPEENPVVDYDPLNRWHILMKGARYSEYQMRISDIMKRQIALSTKLFIIEVDGHDDPLYLAAIKYALSKEIPIERLTYRKIGQTPTGKSLYKKFESKQINVLPEALYD